MNEMQVFQNPEFGKIRSVVINGEPWLVGKDVARALGYSNSKKALGDHVDPEDKRQGDGVTIRDPMGRDQHPTIINESGVYSLILSSKLPSAKKFKRWVTSEVLPTIRRTGSYGSQAAMLGAMERMMTSFTAAMDSILMRLERLENQQITNARAWAANYHPGPRKKVVATPPGNGILRMETFPPDVLSAVNSMMEQMVEEQTLNFSEIARYCNRMGCTISNPSVRRYYDKYYNQH